MRLLFWNTFLLKVQVGGVVLHRKPAVAERAEEIGRAICGRYDVVALAEVFDQAEREAILAAWDTRPAVAVGPQHGRRKSSGLVTISERPVVRMSTRGFRTTGRRWRDSDAWATKGVLLVEVDVGITGANLEIYSTHLFYGGDLLASRRDGDRVRHELRFAQVDELLAMVSEHHRSGNVVLVCGDFNIAAETPSWGERLRERMAAAGFDDLWPTHGDGDGHTCDLLAPGGPTERIDYWFLRRSPKSDVQVGELACRTFPRAAEMPFLSDHAALHLEIEWPPFDALGGGIGVVSGCCCSCED